MSGSYKQTYCSQVSKSMFWNCIIDEQNVLFSPAITLQGVTNYCLFLSSLTMLNVVEDLGLQIRLVSKGTCMVIPPSLQLRGAGEAFPVSHAWNSLLECLHKCALSAKVNSYCRMNAGFKMTHWQPYQSCCHNVQHQWVAQLHCNYQKYCFSLYLAFGGNSISNFSAES